MERNQLSQMMIIGQEMIVWIIQNIVVCIVEKTGRSLLVVACGGSLLLLPVAISPYATFAAPMRVCVFTDNLPAPVAYLRWFL